MFLEIHQRRADKRGAKEEEGLERTGGVTYTEKTEQCHHQTDAIMEPLGKEGVRHI